MGTGPIWQEVTKPEKIRQYITAGMSFKDGFWVSFIVFTNFKTVYAYMHTNGGVFLFTVAFKPNTSLAGNGLPVLLCIRSNMRP